MARVIAGTAGGRRLALPRGRRTRPATDRIKEALFSSVGSVLGSLDGLRVLDLYAGSGAVGLEAASRGAAHVLCVESDPTALRTLRANVDALALPGVRVVPRQVQSLLARGPDGSPYDFVFVDPPYATPDDAVGRVLTSLRSDGWLAREALVVVRRSSRTPATGWPAGYVADRTRRYGDSTLWYGLAG